MARRRAERLRLVANIIVAEAGHEVGGIGFWQYLRVGFPLTLAGLAWLLMVRLLAGSG